MVASLALSKQGSSTNLSEKDIIECTQAAPATVASLVEDLSALGGVPGITLLVHSSLSQLGWVCGGPVAVILALEMILSAEGTLVMPTHSGELSDPSQWQDPPVPRSWWDLIRQSMPAYTPDLTPSRSMGAIPECFRKQQGVLRSGHPQVSFAAWGKHASRVVENHSLDFSLSENSPVAKVYEMDGWILQLGVDYYTNTSLHLAEYRAAFAGKKHQLNGAPVLVNGQRVWVSLQDIEFDTSDFQVIADAFAQETGLIKTGRFAQSMASLMP